VHGSPFYRVLIMFYQHSRWGYFFPFGRCQTPWGVSDGCKRLEIGVPWSPSFVRRESKKWILKIVKVTMNMIHLMPCKNPHRIDIYLASTYSVGPSSVVQNKLAQAPPFPPMRMLEVKWTWALSLVREVALIFCR
jgi:hypothetical protein